MKRIDALINEISNLQLTEDNAFYTSGIFPSQRRHRFLKYKKEDCNIYYPALIAFTLLQLLEKIHPLQREQLQKVINGIRGNYHLYQSTSNLYLYNFYQTNPTRHYPNGYFLSRFNHFKLADDADDTVIITMTIDSVNEDHINTIRAQLVEFSNLRHKQIENTLSKYKDLPAYGVWFGSGRMPIEFDLCVMTNLLCFTFKYNCELNQCDLASLKYIRRAILEEDIEHRPFSISYMYPDTSVMLYHIARLCSMMKRPDDYLPIKMVINKLQDNLSKAQGVIEQIMLSSSLMKMGAGTFDIKYEIDDLKNEFETFSFFRAPMLCGTANPLLNYLSKFDMFHLLFGCDGYYLTLALEYEVIAKTASNKR